MAGSRFTTGRNGARALDEADALAGLRREFHLPKADGRGLCYLCGHSLGLMPRRARAALLHEMNRWRDEAVAGHFGDSGWLGYHERFARPLARLVGGRAGEVVAMNSLTVNLHLMLAGFYRPAAGKFKILIERHAFPSDRYAVDSQLRWHGYDPDEACVELLPDQRDRLSAQALAAALDGQRGTVALVLLPGVQYRNGELLDMAALTEAAHSRGAAVGFDLAHAIGNVPLSLHAWGVDFAIWCSYKYLNGGPGAVGGAFVHSRHDGTTQQRLAGWWGHDKQRRFKMESQFIASPGAEGWQLSNPPIFAMAPLAASLDLFMTAGMTRLRRKSLQMSRYFDFLLTDALAGRIEILTPRAATARGAQISLRIVAGERDAGAVVRHLAAAGVVADMREPDILRFAAAPLYNRFRDIHAAVAALRNAL